MTVRRQVAITDTSLNSARTKPLISPAIRHIAKIIKENIVMYDMLPLFDALLFSMFSLLIILIQFEVKKDFWDN